MQRAFAVEETRLGIVARRHQLGLERQAPHQGQRRRSVVQETGRAPFAKEPPVSIAANVASRPVVALEAHQLQRPGEAVAAVEDLERGAEAGNARADDDDAQRRAHARVSERTVSTTASTAAIGVRGKIP